MNQFSVTLLSLVFVILIGCIEEKPLQPEVQVKSPVLDLPNELNTKILVPLAVGNWWKYETTRRSGSKDSISWRITMEALLNYEGKAFSAMAAGWYHEKDDTANVVRWFYMNDSEGLNVVGGISSHDTMITKYIERKYPATVGDAWEFQELQYGIFQGRGRFVFSEYTLLVSCIATDQLFETPAGTFRCYVYYF